MKRRKWTSHLLFFLGLFLLCGCGSHEQTSSLESSKLFRGNGAAIKIENIEGIKTTLGEYFSREHLFVDFSRAG